MPTNRLEAFSDGVLAIIITIMVLEMEVPHQATLSALAGLWPVFLSYVLSFVYIGIYWNNHHHLMAAADRVSGGILWANLHLLFWLSLLPFATGWMGENRFDTWPTIFYGLDLVACAIAYYILERSIVCVQGEDGMLARGDGPRFQGQALAHPLSDGDCLDLADCAAGGRGLLRSRRGDLDRARPAHRTRGRTWAVSRDRAALARNSG